jgi:ATP-dependent Clp protease ATP-binding subunit ClpX
LCLVGSGKKTGARGLRAILEQVMLEVMYDLPGNEKISKCIVTKASIIGEGKPILEEGQRSKKFESKGAIKSTKKIENAS